MARNQYWIHPALSEVVENALLKLPQSVMASQKRAAKFALDSGVNHPGVSGGSESPDSPGRFTLDGLSSLVGKEVGTGSWVGIDQVRIDIFADATPRRWRGPIRMPGQSIEVQGAGQVRARA
jgi:hypothetical protein